MKNSITLEQIASKIGISRTTIYKVLNNKGNVSPETKAKILTALDEYNCTPISSVAPAVPKEPYTIVYIGMHYVSNNYFSALARRGIQKSYEKYKSKGLRVEIVEADFEHPQQQLQQIVKGLIMHRLRRCSCPWGEQPQSMGKARSTTGLFPWRIVPADAPTTDRFNRQRGNRSPPLPG